MSRTPEEGADLPDELARLPRGRHGLPPEFVARNQRERLIASLTEIVGSSGYHGATIEAITTGAGVSSRTFYKYFETVEECYLAAFDRGVEALTPVLTEAFSADPHWPLALRAALAALLGEFSSYPALARLLTTEPFVAGPKIAVRHRAVVEQLVPCFRRGRELREGGGELPETTEKGLLGGASSRIGRQAVLGDEADFDALLPDLTQFLLTPYLGAVEARRVAQG